MDQPQRRQLRARTRLAPFALLAVIALTAAACGSDDTIDAGDDDDTTVSTQNQADDTDGDDNDGDGDDMADDATVIGTGNINGEVVDPKPHPIEDIAIAESYPEQLMISFTAGDESCLAADARAEAAGDEVVVTLEVGITTDAAARSCVAGEFTHTLTIPLDEGLDGRSVVAAQS